ncbi:MAG: hypothetical protein K2Q10_12165, partial [Rhodospirillales bacterium]|nr:hypothetical protein [Rhodospirillales bacterium]
MQVPFPPSSLLPSELRTCAPALGAAVILTLSLLVTAAAWWITSEQIAQSARSRFDLEVQMLKQEIAGRMQSYQQVLRGGTALFAAQPAPSRQAWRDYVT